MVAGARMTACGHQALAGWVGQAALVAKYACGACSLDIAVVRACSHFQVTAP